MGLFDSLKKIAAETAGSVLGDIPGADRIFDSNSSKPTYPPKNSLTPPPPPAVPQPYETMSVRIAVNGKDYGPYEKATLIEMISNGSLTPQTLVFMEGMTQWTPAAQVPKVSELFGTKGSVPPVPPVPWSSSPAAPPAPQPAAADDGLASALSPKLKSLVISAIADGEISDLERQVLIRNAQAEGMAIDEFAVIVDAMLYNQRQALQQQKELREHELNMAKVHAAAATPQAPAPAKENKRPQVRKCPACGAIINKLDAVSCPECGYEFKEKKAEESIQPLIDQLEEIDSEFNSLSAFKRAFADDKFDERRAKVISTYNVPMSPAAIIAFLSLATSSYEFDEDGEETDCLGMAWKSKMEQVIAMARINFPDNPELMSSIRLFAKKAVIKLR